MKQSFSLKLSILFVAVICLPMILLSVFTSVRLHRMMIQNSQNLNESNLESMANNINLYFDKYKSLMDAFFISDKIQHIASSTPATRTERLACDRMFFDEVQKLTVNSFELENIYLFAQNGSEYFSTSNRELALVRDCVQKFMDEKLVANRSSTYVTGYLITSETNKQTSYHYKVLILRPILNYKTRELLGVIAMEFIPTVFQKLLGYTKDITFLLDGEQRIIYEADGGTMGKELDSILTETREGAEIVEFNQKSYTQTRINTKYGWQIVQLKDYSENNALIYDSLRPILWITFISTVTFAMIAILMAKRLVAPIGQLRSAMKSVESGDMTHHVEIHTQDELEQLGKSYNHMLDNLNCFIEKAYNEEIQRLDAEYRALQSQINPHFLYNTLESINSLAQINQQREIAEMVCSLADMFRYTTKQNDRFVQASQELDCVKNYFLLQSIGYGENVTAEYQIDSNVLKALMPKMILQPVVENCFNHAFEKSSSSFHIVIRGYFKENLLIFEVEDNGVGMNQDELQNLKSRLTTDLQDESRQGSIGLSNIYNRLKLTCGAGSGVEVSSTLHEGTRVILCIGQNMQKAEHGGEANV